MIDTIRVFYPSDWTSVRVLRDAADRLDRLAAGGFDPVWVHVIQRDESDKDLVACGYWKGGGN
jgi:hypothetical protein